MKIDKKKMKKISKNKQSTGIAIEKISREGSEDCSDYLEKQLLDFDVISDEEGEELLKKFGIPLDEEMEEEQKR